MLTISPNIVKLFGYFETVTFQVNFVPVGKIRLLIFPTFGHIAEAPERA